MKNAFIFYFLFINLIQGFSYTIVPVGVVTDSAATEQTRIQEFIDRVQMLQNMVEQIQQTNSMIQNQVRALESLSEGDFEGFYAAFDYQTKVIGQFNDIVSGFDYLKEIEALDELLSTEEFDAFKVDVSCLAESFDASNDFLQSTLDLVQNTSYRIDQQKKLGGKARETESLVGQLQLTNQSLGLLSNELSDILVTSIALNNAILTEEKNKEIKEKISEQRSKEIFYSDYGDFFESEVSDEEFSDAVFGGLVEE